MQFNAAGKAPGVYMQEVDVPGPISGVSTGIVAIVGPAQSGPVNTPVFVTNWTQFIETFGSYIYDPPVYAAHAVRGFFENGGAVCCFTRAGAARKASISVHDRSPDKKPVFLVTARAEGTQGEDISVTVSDANICETSVKKSAAAEPADLQGEKSVQLETTVGLEPGSYLQFTQKELEEYAVAERIDGNTVVLRSPLQQRFSLSDDEDIDVCSLEFSLEIILSDDKKETVKKEEYQNLSVVPYHSRYYEKLTAGSKLVSIEPSDPPNTSLPPYNLPDPNAVRNKSLEGGVNDNPGGLTPEHYRDAFASLERVSVNIVCVPDSISFDPDPTVRMYAVEHCQRMGDRFAVLDCGRNLSVQGAIDQRMDQLGSSSYAAVYYPWIEIPHPAGPGRLKVPPSGHIAGVYARTDDLKGVHKAPGNEVIRGSLGPTMLLNDTEHGMLNEASINAIVNIPGGGVTIMGARTLSNTTQWRYINVRRLLIYIEKSIQTATRFAVFLPNNQSLWATVKRQVSNFLNNVWRSGALFGATPDEAFNVKVDEELNPPSVRALGQLIIEVVLYPVTPAEYVVFRVIQQPGGAEVSE